MARKTWLWHPALQRSRARHLTEVGVGSRSLSQEQCQGEAVGGWVFRAIAVCGQSASQVLYCHVADYSHFLALCGRSQLEWIQTRYPVWSLTTVTQTMDGLCCFQRAEACGKPHLMALPMTSFTLCGPSAWDAPSFIELLFFFCSFLSYAALGIEPKASTC